MYENGKMSFYKYEVLNFHCVNIRQEVEFDIGLYKQGAMSIFECIDNNFHKVKFLSKHFNWINDVNERDALYEMIEDFKMIVNQYNELV